MRRGRALLTRLRRWLAGGRLARTLDRHADAAAELDRAVREVLGR